MTITRSEATPPPAGRVRLLPLATTVAIMVGVTIHPQLLADAAGRADQLATAALCWALSAGFVRGVGFRARRPLPRLMLSGWAVLVGVLLAVLRMQG